MATLPVKWFSSKMQGAPSMAANFGDMVAVLDACLVNGFNLKNVTTLTRTGTVVNMFFANGHGYLVDQVVRSAGWAQAEYNGDFRVTFTDTNNLQFDCGVDTPATPGTSSTTGTVMAAPLDWQIAFTATNKRVYRSLNPASTKPYLRVDNAQHPSWVSGRLITGKVSIAKTMTDVDTAVVGDGMAPYRTDATNFPDWGWFNWIQSQTSAIGQTSPNNGNNQSTWFLIGDDRLFHFVVYMTGSSYYAGRCYCFGDLMSFKASDQYGSVLQATDSYNLTSGGDPLTQGPAGSSYAPISYSLHPGSVLLRGFTGIGAPVGFNQISLNTAPYTMLSGSYTGVPWPNGPDFGLIIHPTYMQETGGHLRGFLPGKYVIHNDVNTQLGEMTVIDNVSGYANKRFIVVACAPINGGNNTAPRVMFDLTGPWR